MKNLVLFLFISLLSLNVTAGEIKGFVKDQGVDPHEPLAFANIEVFDLNTNDKITGVSTGFDGEFSIQLDAGNYKLVASFVGYADQTEEVQLAEGEVKEITFLMGSSITMLTGATVEYRTNTVTNEDIILETKQASGVATNINANAISESGQSDAAGGAKKMVGLSAVGTNVFVRGMGDRYNIAYVNGLPIASVDPDKKVIPLNIFGTSVIKSMNVNKTYDAANYGDYAGGAIDIRTKDYPGKFIMNFSTGVSMNTNTFGKNFMSYEGGKLDYLGLGGKYRALPAIIANSDSYSSQQNEGEAIPFHQNFTPTNSTALLNNSYSFQLGDYIKLDSEKHNAFGYLITASYNNNYNYSDGVYRIINKQNDVKLNYLFDKYSFNTRSSVLANAFYRFKDNQEILYNFMILNTSSDESRDTYGFNFDYQKSIFSRRQTYKQNTLLVNQLRGEHKLHPLRELYFNWAASYNKGMSVEPDRKQLVYLYDENTAPENYIFNAVDRIDNHRFFSELNESEVAISAEVKHSNFSDKMETLPKLPYELFIGFNRKQKSRVFDYRQFVYDLNSFSDAHPNGSDVNNPDAVLNNEGLENGNFYLLEVSNPASLNNIRQELTGIYAKSNINLTNRLTLLVGARYEMGYQDIVYKDQQQPDVINKEIIYSNDILPHLNLKFALKPDTHFLKVALSRTISRPGFKEVVPFEYTEVFAGTITKGNPELTNGYNHNLDVRYEYFTGSSGMIAFAGFAKELINPIERTMLATASGQLQSFQNSNKAQVAGLEAEYVQKLTLAPKNDTSLWNNFNVTINAAYMHSKVSLKDDANSSSTVNTNLERPLQGASPYLINFDIGYQLDKMNPTTHLAKRKTKFILAYNVFGKRVYASGIQGLGDMYELPVNGLNFSIRNKFFNLDGLEKVNLNLSANNLLNPKYRIIQETDLGPETINEFKIGRSFGVNLTYKF